MKGDADPNEVFEGVDYMIEQMVNDLEKQKI